MVKYRNFMKGLLISIVFFTIIISSIVLFEKEDNPQVNTSLESYDSEVTLQDMKDGLTDEEIDKLFQHKLKDYIKSTNLRGDEAIKSGDLILDNHIVLLDIWEPVRYENLNWSMDPYQDNSWKLYLHSLRMVSYLLNAYEESGDESYLEKGKEIVVHWIENNPKEDNPSEWAWTDHSASSRLLVFTHLIELLKEQDEKDHSFMRTLSSAIADHIDYQLSEETYTFPHNHGVMQDRSLIQVAMSLANVKESQQWLKVANGRLEKQLNATVSNDGVHLEHSPFYHLFFINLYRSIDNLLASMDYSLNESTKQKLEQMKEYLAFVSKPNGVLPYIGDTSEAKLAYSLGNEYLEYVVSKGDAGRKPKEIDKVYQDAGIAIFRDEWKEGEAFRNMTHLVFQAGYHSNSHKQADDLSFVLSSLGEDILMDAGKYSYTDDEWRRYVKSSQAHNVVSADNQSYNITNEKYGSLITGHQLENRYSWVEGEHQLLDGVTYSRQILYIRPNVLVVIDTLDSKNKHSYQQNFNLGPTFEIDKKTTNKDIVVANSTSSDLIIKIQQQSPVSNIQIYKGHHDSEDLVNPVRGYISTHTNKLIEINQVEFEKEGSNEEFTTIITLDSSRYKDKVQDIQITMEGNQRKVHYRQNGKLFTITLP